MAERPVRINLTVEDASTLFEMVNNALALETDAALFEKGCDIRNVVGRSLELAKARERAKAR